MKGINMPEATVKIWNVIKKSKFAIGVLVFGVLLMLIPKENREAKDAAIPVKESFSLREEEMRIAQALSQIDGAGSVTVVLTTDSSGTTVVARDTDIYTKVTDTGRETEENTSVIIADGENGEMPVELTNRYPSYIGALIVAEGADDIQVCLKLTKAVSSLTGLGSDKITVVKMKSS